MTNALVTAAVEWLASTGAPNWIVLVALLTSPWTWTRLVRERVGTLARRYLGDE